MKEKIIQYINNHPYCKFSDLCSFYDGKKGELANMVKTLIDEGDIIDDNGYILPSNIGVLKATIVSVKDNFAFALIDGEEEDIHLEKEDMNGAMLHDIVYLRYENNYFKVVKVVKHYYKTVVGEVVINNHVKCVKVNAVACNNVNFILRNGTPEIGDIVTVEITAYKGTNVEVNLLNILGQKNAPFMDVTRLILENGAPIDFPNEVDEEVLSIPQNVSDEDIKDRLDLRNEWIVTIDGDDSKDFDDAVSINKNNDGTYELGVHIADVSYYVKPDSPFDKEALNRGTSIYVTDRVVPMLPFALSNGICSLNEGVDRLTISCIMTIDQTGHVINKKICPSVIKSTHRLTYNYVNQVLAKEKPENYDEEKLFLMNECALLIRAVKHERGELSLDVPELKIQVDNTGYPIAISKKVQGLGEKLIEDFMIAANETVATTIYKEHLPFIYRIHENPAAKRLSNFISFSGRLGVNAYFDPLNVTPKDLQKHMDKIPDGESKQVISATLLRCLAKARYSPDNKGHFGLASECYTHFTSPIRRYPDLIVHRLLRKYLFNNDMKGLNELSLNLEYLAENTSQKERRSIQIERDCDDMKGAEYMSTHVGEDYWGYIDGITNSGIFVELENGLSGCVRFEDMNDYYVVNEATYQAIGKRHHHRYQVGDKVLVTIMKTDKAKGSISLLMHESKKETMNNFTHRSTIRKYRKK